MELLKKDYEEWLKLREKSRDKYGEKLCYCGHTTKCTCSDPNFELFKDAVNRKCIKLNDPHNGWKKKK